MEARLCSIIVLCLCYFGFGAGYRTENFVIRGRIDGRYAKQVGELAETYRRDLAQKWLGYELPRWQQPCPIEVVLKRHAEGRTSFAFQQGYDGRTSPSDWDMMIAGPADRILDAVLPHEITHTIFASHFGRPLPRWADEGACTTVEHISERQKNHRMLIEFLTNDRGIPFNQMFRMKEYPRDILPLYAQGYSLARYFIQQKGHRHFIKYLEQGMGSGDWDGTTQEFYGYENLSDLQVSWVAWIKDGCPKTDASEPEPALLASDIKSKPRQTELQPVRRSAPHAEHPAVNIMQVNASARPLQRDVPSSEADLSQSWYLQQMQRGQTADAGQQRRLKAGADVFHQQPLSQDSRVRASLIETGNSERNSESKEANAGKSAKPGRPRVVCSGGTCKIIR